MIRRLLAIAFAILLLLCLAMAAASLRTGFSVVWKGNAVGAANGVFLWGHYSQGFHSGFAVLHAPNHGPAIGHVLLGFHYFASGKGLRLIGVPLWFPALLCAAAFWYFACGAFSRPPGDGSCLACGYDLRASPNRCPECGTPIPSKVEKAPS